MNAIADAKPQAKNIPIEPKLIRKNGRTILRKLKIPVSLINTNIDDFLAINTLFSNAMNTAIMVKIRNNTMYRGSSFKKINFSDHISKPRRNIVANIRANVPLIMKQELMMEFDSLSSIEPKNLMIPIPNPKFASSASNIINEIIAEAIPTSSGRYNRATIIQKMNPKPEVPNEFIMRKMAFLCNGSLILFIMGKIILINFTQCPPYFNLFRIV
jgi:hypothetical protein